MAKDVTQTGHPHQKITRLPHPKKEQIRGYKRWEQKSSQVYKGQARTNISSSTVVNPKSAQNDTMPKRFGSNIKSISQQERDSYRF